MKTVTIIGAGAMGLFTAWYLTERGIKVQIVDKKKRDEPTNCSYGNAGYVSPSHFIPLASPGVITSGLKWMLDSRSPFYIKPSLNPSLLRWIWLFYKHSTEKHVQNAAKLLFDLNFKSNDLYAEVITQNGLEVQYHRNGLVMIYNSEKGQQKEAELADHGKKIGVTSQMLSHAELEQKLNCHVRARGGLYFPQDAHMHPASMVKSMIELLEKRNVIFHWEQDVRSVILENKNVVALRTNQSTIETDELALCGGAWSPELAKQLGMKLLIQPGKGYSFEVEKSDFAPSIPCILTERRVAVTPFSDQTRFAGTLEISGFRKEHRIKRVEAIHSAAHLYFPDLAVSMPQMVWSGFRPCSPDGLPYIGKSQLNNVWVNAGHAMLGLSLAPVSGLLLTQLMLCDDTSIATEKLNPLRFG